MQRFIKANTNRFTRLATVAMLFLGSFGACQSAFAIEAAPGARVAAHVTYVRALPLRHRLIKAAPAPLNDEADEDAGSTNDDLDARRRFPNWEDGPNIRFPRRAEGVSTGSDDPRQRPNWEDGPQHNDSDLKLEPPIESGSKDRPNWEDGPQDTGSRHGDAQDDPEEEQEEDE